MQVPCSGMPSGTTLQEQGLLSTIHTDQRPRTVNQGAQITGRAPRTLDFRVGGTESLGWVLFRKTKPPLATPQHLRLNQSNISENVQL